MRCEELSSESYLKPGTIALSLSFEDLLGSLSPCSSTKVMSIDNKDFGRLAFERAQDVRELS